MRILVVEDNNQLVTLLTKALGRAGLDVDAVLYTFERRVSQSHVTGVAGLIVRAP